MAKAKKELTPEEKKAQAEAKRAERDSAVITTIVSMAKKSADTKDIVFASITHAIPKKALMELVEEKQISEAYAEEIVTNYPNLIKTSTSSGGGGTRAPREYDVWIDKIENAPKKLIDAGKAFQEALNQFEIDNAAHLELFETYGRFWKNYFRFINPDETEG